MLSLFLILTSALSANDLNEVSYGCNNYNDDEIQCCVYDDEILGFINIDGCVDLIIEWESLDITLALELNDVILFESTFGLDSPPALCTDFMGMNICLDLYDMDLVNGTLSGCVGLYIDTVNVPLGCFEIDNPLDNNEEEI